MKFDICKTLILAVVIMGAGCGNLTEPSSFSFATLKNVPLSTNIQSNVVTIEGNQFGAPITFANASSASYSEININNAGFTGVSGQLLYPGNTLQIQQTSSSVAASSRTTTITVGGFTTTFTTVTSATGGTVTYTDTAGNIVTISNIVASLSANNNVVTYSISGTTSCTLTNSSGNSASTINVTFTLQAISNTGQVVYQAGTTPVSITEGSEGTVALYSGTLPTTVSGNLPNAVLGYPITTTNYWSGLISYWQIAPNSLTFP